MRASLTLSGPKIPRAAQYIRGTHADANAKTAKYRTDAGLIFSFFIAFSFSVVEHATGTSPIDLYRHNPGFFYEGLEFYVSTQVLFSHEQLCGTFEMSLWGFTATARDLPAVTPKRELPPDLVEGLVELEKNRSATLVNALCFSSLAGLQSDLNEALFSAAERVADLRLELWTDRQAGAAFLAKLPATKEAFLEAIDKAAHQLTSKDPRCAEIHRLQSLRLMVD